MIGSPRSHPGSIAFEAAYLEVLRDDRAEFAEIVSGMSIEL